MSDKAYAKELRGLERKLPKLKKELAEGLNTFEEKRVTAAIEVREKRCAELKALIKQLHDRNIAWEAATKQYAALEKARAEAHAEYVERVKAGTQAFSLCDSYCWYCQKWTWFSPHGRLDIGYCRDVEGCGYFAS